MSNWNAKINVWKKKQRKDRENVAVVISNTAEILPWRTILHRYSIFRHMKCRNQWPCEKKQPSAKQWSDQWNNTFSHIIGQFQWRWRDALLVCTVHFSQDMLWRFLWWWYVVTVPRLKQNKTSQKQKKNPAQQLSHCWSKAFKVLRLVPISHDHKLNSSALQSSSHINRVCGLATLSKTIPC